MDNKPKVIIVTDGDSVARKAIEEGTRNIGGRCISASAGNPTLLSGYDIVKLVHQAPKDPVVIMVDDKGNQNKGLGEEALEYILEDDSIDIIGVVAVASNTEGVDGVEVDVSITKDGEVKEHKAVNKDGLIRNKTRLLGDTVDVLNNFEIPIIVGVGDPGKMQGKDDCCNGAPIITKALKEVINRSQKK